MTARPLHILLVRHGQTNSNTGGTVQGHLPTPLNAVGHQQALAVAKRLARWPTPIDALVSSDLVRAMQTASPIAAALNLPIQPDAAWRERSLGKLEGQTVGDEMLWNVASGELEPEGAEPKEVFVERVYGAITALPRRFDNGGTAVVVTHGGPIRIVLKLLLANRRPRVPVKPDRLDLATDRIVNGSILELKVAGGHWEALRLNEVG